MAKLKDYTVSAEIDRVLVICKSHLDIGFTDYSAKVRRAYMEEFIPKAIQLDRTLRAEKTDENFVWNTGSWLLYEYWKQARGAALADFESAVRAGAIAWHALPFTTHTELADPSLFESGLKMARELDAHFDRRTVAAKMTDVPGHTGALAPLLARNGVEFLHIGVNPASPAPRLPRLCRWRRDGRELLLMYAAGDYGADALFPEYRAAVIFAHGGDNSAPMNLGGLRQLFRTLRLQYPNAAVKMGTLDDLAQLLLPHAAEFPVFTGEIGDSWIHGLGTDPGKVARFRALSRFRRERLLAEPGLAPEALGAFERNLLLVAEHTWGMDEKTHLDDDTHWTRPDFEAARAAFPNFAKIEKSWAEQRGYLAAAVAALPAPLRREAKQRLEKECAPRPLRFTAPGTKPPKPDTPHFHAEFNARGELKLLADAKSGALWSQAQRPFFGVGYRSYSRRDVERWLGEYCRQRDAGHAAWAFWDMGKMTLPETLPGRSVRGERAEFETERRKDGLAVKARVAMPRREVESAGAPERFEIEYLFLDREPVLEITVQWFNKAANRAPEAIFADFGAAFSAADRWRMNKLGSAVDPLEVVDGGGRMLHAVNDRDSLVIDSAQRELRLDSLDAPLLLPGAAGLWRYSERQPDLDKGVRFCLYNNQWGTNFPLWYGEDGRFRFRIALNSR